MSIGTVLVLLVLLILSNAFFAMSEIAIISINTNKIKKIAEEGNKKAQSLLKVTSNPSNFLATIQVGVTLSGFLASAIAAGQFVEVIVPVLTKIIPFSQEVLDAIVLIIITMALSYVTLVFGELVPKRIGLSAPDKIALRVIKPIYLFYLPSKPFVAFLAASTNLILRMLNMHQTIEEEVTEEEILLLVEEGEEKGTIEHRERDMIENIFEFDDKKVSEIMTHRTEMIALSIDSSLEEIIQVIKEEGYSRIPVYQNNLDNIIGVLYIKDLLPLLLQQSNPDKLDLSQYLREIPIVPETKHCAMLLKQFQEEKVHIAIVVDEHGGTEGLVTMEDLLEIIVGDIEDEHDDEEEDVVKISESIFVFEASTPVEEVEEYLQCDAFAGDDYETIGGFVIEALGRIPQQGETIPAGDYLLTVLEADNRKILKIQVEKNLENDTTETETEENN